MEINSYRMHLSVSSENETYLQHAIDTSSASDATLKLLSLLRIIYSINSQNRTAYVMPLW